MVNYSPQALDAVFSALSDKTRRAILERLTCGEASVSDLAEPFDMSLPAVTKHLRILENVGLVTREKEGRVNYVRLVAAPMKDAAEWLDHYRKFWEAQFDGLADFLAATSGDEHRTDTKDNDGVNT